MKLHIMSDIHLEYYQNVSSIEQLLTKIPSLYDTCHYDNLKEIILVLAGDIGYILKNNYWDFLKDCCQKYKYVICIKGNHEYYITRKSDKKYNFDELEKIASEKANDIENLYYLSNDKIILDGFTFLGTTLWSFIPDEYKLITMSSINDYNYIYHNNTNITTEFINNINREQTNWLLENINTEINNIIIITHHVPIKELVHSKYDKYKDILHSFQCTNLPNEIFSNKIKLWICGHTHTPMECEYKNIKFISNPIGYYGENINPNIREYET